MKKITLTLFFLFSCFVSFAQVATVKTIRVVNPTTAIGENIPVGTIIIDISTNKMYVAKTGIASTETITTSIVNLDLKFAASSIVDNLTTGGATVPLSADQGVALKGLVDTNITAIGLNTAKVTNVNTDLSITGTTDARTIVSSDGNDAIIPVATTSVSGLMSTTIFDAVTANSSKTITTVVNDLTTGGTADALSAQQGVTLKGLVDLNVTTASIVNEFSTGGTAVPLSAEQGKALNALITNKKQSYLQTDTFSETNGTASPHALTKAVTPTATNEVNFKVSVNGGVVSATVITYNSGDNTITLSGIFVAQYDVVTVLYTTNE
jgi:hypothetical protein